MAAVHKGERPRRPDNAESLGFSDTLWRLIRTCWSESSSTRPTAQQLLRYFEDASHTWVPPSKYPIPGDLDGGVGLGLTSGDELSGATSVPTSDLFPLLMGML